MAPGGKARVWTGRGPPDGRSLPGRLPDPHRAVVQGGGQRPSPGPKATESGNELGIKKKNGAGCYGVCQVPVTLRDRWVFHSVTGPATLVAARPSWPVRSAGPRIAMAARVTRAAAVPGPPAGRHLGGETPAARLVGRCAR